jgi:precorrin-2 dehydrogenase / sirohydrochlorin ferrochelatase
MSSLFPMFLKLAGRRCLVVGAGTLAEPKIESLLRAGAETLVVAPKATPKVTDLASNRKLVWRSRIFDPADLDDQFLVIAATSSPDVNDGVFQEAKRQRVLCNVVDDPERCDFYYPALVRRGHFQIAISTGGLSPALAQRIRQELERQFGMEYESWLEQLSRTRRELLASPMDRDKRLFLLHRLASREAFREFIQRTTVQSRPA